MSKRALIVHTGGGLGDVLLSGPVIDSMKQAGYKVDFLARESTSAAIARHPGIEELLTIEGKDPRDRQDMKKWARLLRERDYDVSLLLWSTTRWAWTLFLADIPNRVGQSSRLLYSFLFTHKVKVRSEYGDENTHWTDILLDYPRKFGIEAAEPKLQFPLKQSDRERADQLLANMDFSTMRGPIIGFHSGKGLPLGPERWPVRHFARLATQLQEDLDARLILTGGPAEHEIVDHVSRQLLRPHANIAGKTSLHTLAAIQERCVAFVCPDSGPMHLAAAVNTPVVGIYALDEDFPKRWAPFGVTHRIVRPPRPACPTGCRKPTCPNFQCYLKVQPSEVAAAVKDVMRLHQR